MADMDTTLVINPIEDINKLKALASEPRIQMLNLLRETTLNINGGKFDNNNSLPINVSESAKINFNSGSISNNSSSDGNGSASINLKNGTLTIGKEAICINNTNGTYSGSLIWVGSKATAKLIEEVLPTNTLYENNIEGSN